VIPEQIGVAHIGLQHVHAFVPAHVAHLENAGAPACRAGEKSRPRGMGAEIGRFRADPLGVGFDEVANALIGETIGAEPANGSVDAAVQFCEEHGQSLDWLLRGNAVAMVCDAARRSPRAAALATSADAELLRLVDECVTAHRESERWMLFRRREEKKHEAAHPKPDAMRFREEDLALGIPGAQRETS
jgi:hypothetical protein